MRICIPTDDERGREALDRSRTRVLITGKETVSEIAAEVREGGLKQLTLDEACGGHHAPGPHRHGSPPCGKAHD